MHVMKKYVNKNERILMKKKALLFFISMAYGTIISTTEVIWQSENSQLVLKAFTHAQALKYLSAVHDLDLELLDGFPYLYDFTQGHDEGIIRGYFEGQDGAVLILFDKDIPVGFSTSIPLANAMPVIQEDFIKNGLDVHKYLYIGEIMIRPSYRGQGVLRKMFEYYESRAQKLKCEYLALITVNRADDYPARPITYRPVELIWQHFGFEKSKDIVVLWSWVQTDTQKKEDNVLGVWCKKVGIPSTITIKPLIQKEVEELIAMIMKVYIEVEKSPLTVEQARQEWDKYNDLYDCVDINKTYFDNDGTFVIARDGETIIASGSLRKIDNESCELKRMYVLKEYRGKGIGNTIAQKLLDFARSHGYKKVYLIVWRESTQGQAIQFYKKLGFSECEPYQKSPAELFMSKEL